MTPARTAPVPAGAGPLPTPHRTRAPRAGQVPDATADGRRPASRPAAARLEPPRQLRHTRGGRSAWRRDARSLAGRRIPIRLWPAAALADLHRRIGLRHRAGVALRPDPADAGERQD